MFLILIYFFCVIKKDIIIKKFINMFNGNLMVIFILMEVLSFFIDFYILFKNIVIVVVGIFNFLEIWVIYS